MFSRFGKGSPEKSAKSAANFGADIDIRSSDIDPSKFSVANWEKMKEKFKDDYIDRATRDNKERPYSPTEVSDETIARYLLARNDNYDKASALLEAVVSFYSYSTMYVLIMLKCQLYYYVLILKAEMAGGESTCDKRRVL